MLLVLVLVGKSFAARKKQSINRGLVLWLLWFDCWESGRRCCCMQDVLAHNTLATEWGDLGSRSFACCIVW